MTTTPSRSGITPEPFRNRSGIIPALARGSARARRRARGDRRQETGDRRRTSLRSFFAPLNVACLPADRYARARASRQA